MTTAFENFTNQQKLEKTNNPSFDDLYKVINLNTMNKYTQGEDASQYLTGSRTLQQYPIVGSDEFPIIGFLVHPLISDTILQLDIMGFRTSGPTLSDCVM